MRNDDQPTPSLNPLTRRGFLKIGSVGVAGVGLTRLPAATPASSPLLAEAVSKLQYLTPDKDFLSYGRGKPPPDTLPEESRRAAGLTPDTWRLEVLPDPESDPNIDRPLSQASGTALTWTTLMRMAETRAVRFLSVMACTNGRQPCGMGLWEGVPLRDVVWLTRPTGNIRRVFYYGFHNHDPAQRFQSSLPIGRVLEDPPGEHPVILCYKLNGQWLTPKRGGPVRMLVPGAYGNKSVKWLQHIFLTNNPQANDTYAEWNNDTDSALKTCARFLEVPNSIRAGQSVAITGLAQVGLSGLSQVQICLHASGTAPPPDDPYWGRADWTDAVILPPPKHWGAGLPEGQLPSVPRQIDPTTGQPHEWPLRYTVAHWAALLPPLDPGRYDLSCRTIDTNGTAQPMPRPFAKSGHNAIQKVELQVQA